MYFDETHFSVIQSLLPSKSFLVHYSDVNRRRRWFLVGSPEDFVSRAMSDTACDDLVNCGLLIPRLSDKEFEMQQALGLKKGREYALAEEFSVLACNCKQVPGN